MLIPINLITSNITENTETKQGNKRLERYIVKPISRKHAIYHQYFHSKCAVMDVMKSRNVLLIVYNRIRAFINLANSDII